MTKDGRTPSQYRRRPAPTDAHLVRACLRGKERAWSNLVDRYKNLIYSIPIKHGLSEDEAADIFQSVCLELLRDLPQLRDPRALPAWLIKITSRKCFHWKRKKERHPIDEDASIKLESRAEPDAGPDELLSQLEQEQTLRDALSELGPRCRRLVGMLFYEAPPRPYAEIARSLRLARGSISYLRRRCLHRLRRALAQRGFE